MTQGEHIDIKSKEHIDNKSKEHIDIKSKEHIDDKFKNPLARLKRSASYVSRRVKRRLIMEHVLLPECTVRGGKKAHADSGR